MPLPIPERIETLRLVIRPFTQSDTPAFIDFMTDDVATKYLAFTAEQKTKPGATKLLQETLDSYSGETPIFALTVAIKDTDEYVGSVGLMPVDDSCEIYWSISRTRWNQGYGQEAVRALVNYAVEQLGVHKVTAHTHPDNVASYKLAEKCGFEYRGIVQHPFLNEPARLYVIEK